MAPSFALLASPLLGPAVWEPAAALLAERGWPIVTCAVSEPAHNARHVLDSYLAALPAEQEFVLVPHSNAGAYVPLLAAQRPAVAAIFVDAVVPPEHGQVPLAPAEFLHLLRGKAGDDGMLPLWTEWWDETEVVALFPDGRTRARVEAEQHRLPLAYFADALTVPAGWAALPCGYLAFGDGYAAERDEAQRRGWPVSTLAGEHLHMLVEPARVASELLALLDRCSASG